MELQAAILGYWTTIQNVVFVPNSGFFLFSLFSLYIGITTVFVVLQRPKDVAISK